jgi:pimeloyl-ACP methyl ester carboxylesterase
MRTEFLALGLALISCASAAQKPVTIEVPGAAIPVHGDLYGSGSRGLILAHGGRFNKESWMPQVRAFADAGFTVLAINFRGDRVNPDGSPSAEGSTADNAADVLASARYLHGMGVKSVSAIGASLGGDAVGEADAANPGEFECVVFLASEGGDHPEKLTGRKLYIVARGDASDDGARLPRIKDRFARAPEPKNLVLVDGTAHAQYLFGTSEGPRVMQEILAFLLEE